MIKVRDVELSDVLTEFACTLVTDLPVQAILQHLVERVVSVMPITSAGVSIVANNLTPMYVAASDQNAMRYEDLQAELGEGPCVTASETGEAVLVADLGRDKRFPEYGPRALAEGLQAVFTFPLHHGEDQLGALDLYRDTHGPLDADMVAVAQTLADVAAAYLVNAQVRSDLQESSERFRHHSLHDPLTGLPNRVLLREHLDHAIARARRSHQAVAILFADLDKFKQVNDRFGHQVGDELLIAMGQRLRRVIRSGDTVARWSGDEFVVLAEDLADPSHVDILAERIDKALTEPFVLSTVKLHMTASVGVAFTGQGQDVPDRVLQDADQAMYMAKRRGGARHIVDLNEHIGNAGRSGLADDLRRAGGRGQLRNDYQPIVSSVDGEVIGVEALLRWAHPQRGVLAPSEVMPLADQTGVSDEIARRVLERACLDRHRWQHTNGARDLELTVNISNRQLLGPDFSATVAEVLHDTATDPTTLTLDLTEGVFSQDGDRAIRVLKDLERLGVTIAIDHFGRGDTSIAQVEQLPVSVVKVDTGLAGQPDPTATGSADLNALVDVAHNLDMTIAAKRVETADQRRTARDAGCESSQGYFFAHPMTANKLQTLTAARGSGRLYLPR